MPSLGCRSGKSQTCRTCPHNGQALGFSPSQHHLCFMTSARIDQAAGQTTTEYVVQACLITGDAGVDLIGSSLLGLLHKKRIRQKGRAMDTISASPRANTSSAISGVLIRLEVITGIDNPLRNFGSHPGKGRSRHFSSYCGNTRFMPTDTGVDDGRPGLFYCLPKLENFLIRTSSSTRSSMDSR